MEFEVIGFLFTIEKILGREIDDKEEKKAEARKYVTSLPIGGTIDLKKEPTNEFDHNAVAAYYNAMQVAYISSEDATDVLRIMGDRKNIKATISGNDGNRMLIVNIDTDLTDLQILKPDDDNTVIPPMPLATGVYYTPTQGNAEVELRADNLLSMKFCKDNAQDILQQVKGIMPLLCLTPCRYDVKLMRILQRKLKIMICKEDLDDATEKALHEYTKELKEKVSDFKHVEEHVRVYREMKERMEEKADSRNNLYNKYERSRARIVSDVEADQWRDKEIEKFTLWLHDLPEGLGQYYLNDDEEAFANKMVYMQLSRQDMFCVMSIILLMEKLQEEKEQDTLHDATWTKEEVINALTPIFYGLQAEVEKYLKKIEGATNMQIHEVTNELIKEKVVSKMSCKKPMWEALHNGGYYTATDVNWRKHVG